MPSKKIQVALPLLLSVVMIVGMFIGYQLRSKTGNAPLLSTGNQSSLPELIRLVREKYVDEVSADSIDQLVSNELLSHLDPHSVWMSATDLQDVEDEMNESFQGIGIEFQLLRDSVHVMFVIPGAPAAKAGILTGDVLLSINDTLLLSGQKRSPAGVRKALRGQPTPDLRLALLRNGKRIETKLTKGTVPLPAVDAAFLLQPGTGYIHMSKFANRT
ncbi:MAG: S41 family peptidase, partial [Bacteroidota bacterium]